MSVVLVGLSLPGVENHGIGALRAALRSEGIEDTFVPFSGFSSLEETLNAVLALRPRVVGLSLQTIESALAVTVLAHMLRSRGYGGRIVIGGHFATLNAEDLLRAGAGVDAVVRFAGEEALVEIARGAFDDTERRRSIPGIVFLDSWGSVQRGAPPRWTSTSVLARAARFDPLPEHLGFVAADLVASRGCESHCAYCCIAAASDMARKESGDPGAAYERRPLESLAQEIADLHHEYGARVFNFMDDNVLPSEPNEAAEWASELRERLDAKRVGRLAISLQVRADAIDERSAEALARLGLARAYVGVDGYSRSQLRALGRRADASAGHRAIEHLWRNGVFSVVNALLVGPTIPFQSVVNEIEGLSRLEHAPVHLLPIEVRAGTSYFRAAQRRGLVEGGFLGWHYRFADARTERMAEILTSFPTRLAERSVPIALYDLGYNLGVARRLQGDVNIAAHTATYARVAADWNRDQLRVLRGAAAVSASGDSAAVKAFIARELIRVTLLDRALLEASDRTMLELELDVSRLRRRRVSSHARGRLLGGVAFSMSLAACRGTVHDRGVTPIERDAALNDANGGGATSTGGHAGTSSTGSTTATGGTPSPDASDISCTDASRTALAPQSFELPDSCACGGPPECRITFDAEGRAVAFTLDEGGVLTPEVESCLKDLLSKYCYPSLAGRSHAFQSHCWIA